MTRWYPFAIALVVVCLDRCSKAWIEARVDFWQTIPVVPGFFHIVHTRNKGIAFGIFNDSEFHGASWILLAFTLLVILFLAQLLWRRNHTLTHEHWTMIAGLSLVLGGASGNAYDRIRFGSVTDFLDFFWGNHHFPAFNVADSAITVGAGLLLLNLWFARNAPR